jgi:non-specific serine/threonine protein kinase
MSTAQPDPPRQAPAGQATFGELLRQYRLAAGLTQEALAERAGLSGQSLSLLETGKRQAPYRHTMALLVRALGLSAEQVARLEAAVMRSRLPAGAGIVEFPSLSASQAPRTNLPAQLTSFIGREREIAEVTDLLTGTRLLTLTGTGGVGKTRLALQVATALLDRYPQGVWLVELASLADPALMPAALMTALEVQEQRGGTAMETLLEALRTRHLLLVLDNCEHLRVACARLSEVLLRNCLRLHILATSREPLGLAGETRWRVPSLSVPATDQGAHLDPVARYEAVQLFLERAQAVRPQFALTAANVAAVARVCAQLDGIPLAIELAAARLSGLGVADLATRLDQRFRLLTGGSPTALPRQQTLQATVEWSYGLLTPPEQTLFARLSVFAGGWSLEGAEAVGAGGAIAMEEVLDLLASLVNRSLVLAEELDDGSTRYWLLETLRQYGQERLAAAEETAQVQHRHTGYYLALTERAALELNGPGQLRWLDRLEREHANLRAALAWCVERSAQAQGDEDAKAAEIALRLAGSLHFFWLFRDHHAEGLAWLERALARGAAAPAAVRASALMSAGVLAGLVNDLARSYACLTQSVVLSREIGAARGLCVALCPLGSTTWGSEQDKQADAVLEESLALARGLGEPWLIGLALLHSIFRVANSAAIERAEERARAWTAGAEALRLFQAAGAGIEGAVMQLSLGQIALYERDYGRARAAFAACLPMLRTTGWQSTVADGLAGLADVAREQGDDGEAVTFYTEGLALYRQGGDHLALAISRVLCRLADLHLAQGNWAVAQAQVTESLVMARDTRLVGASVIASALAMQAALAAMQGTPARAVRLAGAAAALRAHASQASAASERAILERRVTFLPPSPGSAAAFGQATLERGLASARQALSAAEQAAAWAEGEAMTPEQAIAYALEGLPL